ncbi:ribonuclease H-like domain-containing protein [Pyrenochaeta sp. MPI-SDFR-AT-0127]|nr:ribonuclease H-like domain-containing protein [Pyrenochaeta sp. MPI-SDFR-AT-0127]
MYPTFDCLLKECPLCGDFLLYCCACNNQRSFPPSRHSNLPCHHYRIMFTDGACTNNGQRSAKAGIGVAYGNTDDSQFSVPITDLADNFPLRSNQRAELYAAIKGLQFLDEANKKINPKEPTGVRKDKDEAWIIATNSEYVARGMTEWLPTWKRNNWRTAKYTKPVNLDLFLALDSLMAKHEAKDVKIGFWRIPREHNTLADSLAQAAAVHGDMASIQA